MSLCIEGLSSRLNGGEVTVFVQDKEPLIQLGNLIDWEHLKNLAEPDLKKTRGSFWWLGRKLYVRIHLAVMILQALYKWTDRETEIQIKTTPVYQIFCGLLIVVKWHCPDHTKIETFRNRLSPETYMKIIDYILNLAVGLGLGNPKHVDIDSTVQEANISYPSDATLMKKLSLKAHKFLAFLQKKLIYGGENVEINIEKIIKKFQSYIFLAKNVSKEKKQRIFKEYYVLVKSELEICINYVSTLPLEIIESLPWNYRDIATVITNDTRKYLEDVGHFVKTGKIMAGKILSWKMRNVICVAKGKLGKLCEFGRVFQLGRIEGNFLVPYTCDSLQMPDKASLPQIILEHQAIFDTQLESVTTDKGYYTGYNVEFVKEMTGDALGVQRPANAKDQGDHPQKKTLFNRRAGVEPLIGHVKEFGLGKSRMKSDEATLASGYRSVLGFNIHQLLRRMGGGTQKQSLQI